MNIHENKKHPDAAIRAGNYLKLSQDSDGNWIKGSFSGARTYEARVDWALLRLARLTCDNSYKDIAIKIEKWFFCNRRRKMVGL